MSNTANTVALPIASNEEIWNLLMDVTNVKEGSMEEMATKLFGSGLKNANDLDILANLPKVVRSIADSLKDIPAKKFLSEMKSRSVTSKLPFCPICRDAGLSAEEYTSHHIWSDDTRETVVCPTLLAHQCEKCGEMGHMPSYCGRTKKQTTPTHTPEIEKPKHCKVCYQAGFGPEVYSSHFTKVDGEILCPTILNNPCHRCGRKGHTPKYCTITVRTDRRPVIATPQPYATKPPPQLAPRFFQTENTTQTRTNKQQQMNLKYRDERYIYDEDGRQISMKQCLPEEVDPYYTRPQHIGKIQSQNVLMDAIGLLARAQASKSPEECARLVKESMQLQEYLLQNL
jgi:hypothetical protein